VGPAYEKAVEAIAQCRGKVIVTGVGKSGFIAQKVAATFSSTGTPAAFLDPSAAMHGGLGFIEHKDLIIAIGKSGESDELTSLLPAIGGLGATIIAITANPKSTLAKYAKIVLDTPIEAEACPLDLAPTSSTTAALAVGDALAVALMKKRNFKAEQFARNHPAGRLGKRLTLRVLDVMRSQTSNPAIPLETPVSDMLLALTRFQAGAVSVVDKKGRLIGLITDYDVRKALGEGGVRLFQMGLSDIMNGKPTSVLDTEPAAKAISIMEQRKNPFNVLPVVDKKGRCVGMIQIHDLRARGL
jgi:arabinose-5-phosphate isomerase